MPGLLRHRHLIVRRPARAVWRRVIRWAEPLESRQFLSAVGLIESALDNVLALPAVHAAPLVTNTVPSGDTPTQISRAYGFDQVKFSSGANGTGQTIAIVDAYGDSKVKTDLQTFDTEFGLPAPPSFKIVNQNGGTKLPSNNSGWALETSLDVEWAHAMAPGANLLLVEASNSSLGNLLTAVNYARQQPGVVAVSMSWGAGEFSSEISYDSYFTTPKGHGGVTFVAASGDNGAGTIWPAVSPNVLSAGGTTLTLADSSGTYGSESGWSGSGGGVSRYEPQPAYQAQSGLVTQSTSQRTVPDVAYNADPNSGVAVYDSVAYNNQSGWFQVGGTSAAAPQWAALVAVADQGRQVANAGAANPLPNAQASVYNLASTATSYSSDFHDITTGSNGTSALDQGAAGYDLVTGLGTPKVAALVQGLVAAPTTAVITTASSASGKSGSGSPADATLDPTVVAEILFLNTLPPFPTPGPVVPLVTPQPNAATPAASIALPASTPVQFATNSLITDDDPLAVPFKPAKKAPSSADNPPASEDGTRPSRQDLGWAQTIEDLPVDMWSSLSSGIAPASQLSVSDACFADAELTAVTADAAAMSSGRAEQFAGLIGLVAAVALADRSRPGNDDQPLLPRLTKSRRPCP